MYATYPHLLAELNRLKAQVATLTVQAHRDELTGLHNRTFLQEWIHQHQEDTTPVLVAYIDIDRLKHINDLEGHLSGDALLRQVAAALKGCCHQHTDLVIRLCGDEFLMIVSHTSEQASVFLKYQLTERLQQASQRLGHAGFSFGIEKGIAKNIQALIAQADRKMYHSKLAKKYKQEVVV